MYSWHAKVLHAFSPIINLNPQYLLDITARRTRLQMVYYMTQHIDFTKGFLTVKISDSFITHEGNFIYAYKKSMAIPVLICT